MVFITEATTVAIVIDPYYFIIKDFCDPYYDIIDDIIKDFCYPYDTIKDFCYLFLGIAIAYGFWELCERYYRRGLRYINPFLFFVMVIWGVSGFFFLNPLLLLLRLLPNDPVHPNPIFQIISVFQLLSTAVPDLDIPLYRWAKFLNPNENWEILMHRSLLFSSVIIPFILMFTTVFFPILFQNISNVIRNILNFLYISAIGLFIGISSHLLGDMLFMFIPSGDISIKIYNWEENLSLLWLVANTILGIFIPLVAIMLIHFLERKKS